MRSTLPKSAGSGARCSDSTRAISGNEVPGSSRASVCTPDRRPIEALLGAPAGRRHRKPVLFLVGAAGLLLLVLLNVRVSSTFDVNSDNASIVLEAQSFVQGNYLLHGWSLSTVPFLLELPFYAVGIPLHGGVHPVLMHVVPSILTALTVFLAVWLAGRGSARRSPALGRTITFLLIGLPSPLLALHCLRGPGHLSTVATLLAALLVIDAPARLLMRPTRRLLLVGLLALAIINDAMALYVLLLPLAIVCLWRISLKIKRADRAELYLLAAGGMAWVLSNAALWLITWAGGFHLPGMQVALIPIQFLGENIRLAVEGILGLTGAGSSGPSLGSGILRLLHLPGLALILFSLGRVLASWQTSARSEERVPQLLATGMLVNLGAYVASAMPFSLYLEALRTDNAHYLLGMGLDTSRYLLPFVIFGAVLAGRVGIDGLFRGGQRPVRGRGSRGRAALGQRGRPKWPAVIALTILSLAHLGAFAQRLGAPVQIPSRQALCDWLQAHGLRSGYSTFWNANIVTVLSGGQVKVRQIVNNGRGAFRRPLWLCQEVWYRDTSANFLVCDPVNIDHVSEQAAEQFFGPSSEIHQVGFFKILVWKRDRASGPTRRGVGKRAVPGHTRGEQHG